MDAAWDSPEIQTDFDYTYQAKNFENKANLRDLKAATGL